MPGMSSSGSPSAAELDAVLTRVKPRLAELFSRYEVRVEEASLIMEQTMLALLYKWDEIDARENWLQQTVQRRCHRLAQSRGREPQRSSDPARRPH